jgi:hypothetical protein
MQKQFRLWASASPSDGGTVGGQGYFDAGSTVTLKALPAPSFEFKGWSNGPAGAVTSTYPLSTFKLTQPWYRVANFSHPIKDTRVMSPILLLGSARHFW